MEEVFMGAKSEALAEQFEGKVQEVIATLRKLSDADWKKITEAEKWSVGVTAHHLAGSLGAVAGIVSGLASGQFRGHFTRAKLDEMNTAHAKEHANCSRSETIGLLKKGAAAAATVLRGLSDNQLARTGTVFADVPPMTVEQLVTGGLIDHINEHFGSIRKTVGS